MWDNFIEKKKWVDTGVDIHISNTSHTHKNIVKIQKQTKVQYRKRWTLSVFHGENWAQNTCNLGKFRNVLWQLRWPLTITSFGPWGTSKQKSRQCKFINGFAQTSTVVMF